MGSGFGSFLKKFGTAMVLKQGDSAYAVRGFLQKSGSVAWKYVQKRFSQLGSVPAGRYVYIGPASPVPAQGDTLMLGDTAYELRQVEMVMLRDETLYCWGLCVEKGGADTWGS